MPRLSPSLVRKAYNISPLLPLLLPACRTLASAQNELRWLRQHMLEVFKGTRHPVWSYRSLLLRLCKKRSQGVPLQYLLGSQPFGDLEILCRPGVLIPRPETEAYTSRIAGVIQKDATFNSLETLKILDLCTGTGCIPLLLHALLSPKFPEMQVLGVDVSRKVLDLAAANLRHGISQGHLRTRAFDQVSFSKADVVSCEPVLNGLGDRSRCWDIVTSNPPYISQDGFNRTTGRSVRIWEPKLALVPPVFEVEEPALPPEDIFYPSILRIGESAQAKLVLMEVADMQQALRVAEMALQKNIWTRVEIWRDWLDGVDSPSNRTQESVVGQHSIQILGTGHGRAVVCRR